MRFLWYYTLNEKNESHVFASSLTASNTKHMNLTWSPMTLSVLDMIIVQSAEMTSQALISKIHCTLLTNQKRDSEFNV